MRVDLVKVMVGYDRYGNMMLMTSVDDKLLLASSEGNLKFWIKTMILKQDTVLLASSDQLLDSLFANGKYYMW